MRTLYTLLIAFSLYACTRKPVVFQTDFGLKDGAVAEMKGVALTVDPGLKLYDLTHEIPAYNIWEAAYRLNQTVSYWPEGTVFVSVVDPGVGTSRKSVVLLTKSGHYIVTPDNGTLTLVAESLGIDKIREIDETENRREGSDSSHTFHGRDVYAYTAARLASGKIEFKDVGPRLPDSVVTIQYQRAEASQGSLKGNIPGLDVQYGNVWSNIPGKLVFDSGIKYGDTLNIEISHKDSTVFTGRMPFARTFGELPEGKDLAYMNSLNNLSVAINMGNFSSRYNIYSGADWTIVVRK